MSECRYDPPRCGAVSCGQAGCEVSIRCDCADPQAVLVLRAASPERHTGDAALGETCGETCGCACVWVCGCACVQRAPAGTCAQYAGPPIPCSCGRHGARWLDQSARIPSPPASPPHEEGGGGSAAPSGPPVHFTWVLHRNRAGEDEGGWECACPKKRRTDLKWEFCAECGTHEKPAYWCLNCGGWSCECTEELRTAHNQLPESCVCPRCHAKATVTSSCVNRFDDRVLNCSAAICGWDLGSYVQIEGRLTRWLGCRWRSLECTCTVAAGAHCIRCMRAKCRCVFRSWGKALQQHAQRPLTLRGARVQLLDRQVCPECHRGGSITSRCVNRFDAHLIKCGAIMCGVAACGWSSVPCVCPGPTEADIM
jgi:hypothetical protein